MLPVASFKNDGTELILERFTLTMFYCKRQTWICTTWPSFTLTWLLQNKSCLGQFLSSHFLFWIYNCRKRDSEVSLYRSLKYYWKINETSTENQSLVTILLTSQFFLLYNKYLQSHLSRCSYMWLPIVAFGFFFNLIYPGKLITIHLRLNSSSGVVAATTFDDYIKQQKGPLYKEENWLKRHYALKKGNICIRWSTPGFIVSVLKQTISH